MSQRYILAIDQGTSGTKSVIFDLKGNLITKATVPVKSYYPQPGFVEQDPIEIYESVLESVNNCVTNISESQNNWEVACAGISNQRETLVLWDEKGLPLYNAIVWQCKRSIEICQRLQIDGLNERVNQVTGLILDPYFSATKIIWLYENVKMIRKAIKNGEAYFGTIDSWLLFNLTKEKTYLTDYTNASRTLLFNINDLRWDKELIDNFGLTGLKLPKAKPSSFYYGKSSFGGQFESPISITSMIGDSHAAAFGEGCYDPGMAKATLGTGSSILMNTGGSRIQSKNGMMTTICWSTKDRVDYALEGVIVSCGATIKWLQDQISLIAGSEETESMAKSVEDNSGVYFIPAFSGLGAPHWKMDAQAAIMGLTFGSDKNHIVRAALESIPYQIKDVINAMEQDSEIKLKELMVDGGITGNQFVIQFLADLLRIKINSIGIEEVSALGAAYLAGLGSKIISDIESLRKLSSTLTKISPSRQASEMQKNYDGWLKHVGQIVK